MITEVPRFTKICAETGQEIVPGQTVYSLLTENNDRYVRKDYCVDGWKVRSKNLKNSTEDSVNSQKTSENQDKKKTKTKKAATTSLDAERIVGWWKHKVPSVNEKKTKQAPNDILLKIFDELADQWNKQEMRYVLALLLIRRRVFRLEREETIENTTEKIMILYAPKTDTTYEVPAAVPDEGTMEQIQNELMQLLSE